MTSLGLGDAAPVAASELGQIRTKDGYSYQLTPEDLIWLARSVQFEGGDPASTIWTYAQRQAKMRRTSSLAALVRGHSQPVNPLWDEATDAKCQQYPDRCTPAMLARRAQARTMSWANVSSGIRDKILRWASAQLPNPVPRAVDFADPPVSRSFISRNPGTRIVKAVSNWYLATPDVLGWPADFVTMQHAGRVAGPSATAALSSVASVVVPVVLLTGAAAAAGGLVYLAWKKRRGA
jgi:hypothetical protein